eukprot:jgi/Botrbrau1/12300/Bobra.27_5s0011.1
MLASIARSTRWPVPRTADVLCKKKQSPLAPDSIPIYTHDTTPRILKYTPAVHMRAIVSRSRPSINSRGIILGTRFRYNSGAFRLDSAGGFSVVKSLSQLVTKLGKLKAEAKKIRKAFKQVQTELDKLPTGSSAELRAEVEKKIQDLAESVERKQPWYFTYMDELGNDDPVIQQQYDMEIGLSDSADGEEWSEGIDAFTTPQDQENRSPLSDVTNKRSRSKEGGTPHSVKAKEAAPDPGYKTTHPRRHQAAGSRRQSISKRAHQKVGAEASSGKGSKQQQFFEKLYDKQTTRSENFLVAMVDTVLSRTSTTNTSAPPTQCYI